MSSRASCRSGTPRQSAHLFGATLFAVAIALLAAAPARADVSGAKIWEAQCARCHGEAGQGVTEHYPEPLVGDQSIPQLAAVIAKTMPEDTDEKCSPEDATAVATYIYDAFYSPDAQTRNKPPRIELSRLTVRQYQNAVTDLLASFGGATAWTTESWEKERGLKAEYYRGRRFRREDRKLERVDAQVNFAFGGASPEPETIEAHEFSIRWEGAILAPDTGDYEFVVRTEHAARLWVNDSRKALIDAWVKSGDETEYRATIRLMAGRVYPLKLEFSKAKQGVDDSNKDKDKPKPEIPASIALLWQRPHHTLEVVSYQHLAPQNARELFVLQTPFPPDDKSVGYEKGSAISKAWAQATTDAAIEVAGYIEFKANQLADVNLDNPAHEHKLREFCTKFVERAFRRPLTDDDKRTYVDRHFEESADRRIALKRVVLLALKSPWFLYREVGAESSPQHTVASRLAFCLWDSIPDDELLRAAREGQLANREQVVAQLDRMSKDTRTQAKLREFLLAWLKANPPPDLSKDSEKFPEFTPEVMSDLRASLELRIDELLASEGASFRTLLLDDSLYLNGRLARVYGVELAEEAPFQKLSFEPQHRSGVLSHPYLLAGFAYTSTSSPIHRGVFLSRSLLGRTLRPPPDAVSPLAPDLHAELTTRQRVTLQTQAEACQTCHNLINPLGFALEHFDALGRYRDSEKDQPIDASGSYLARSGELVQFQGAKGLASFIAESEETHLAVVQHLFHHAVKQPIRAYGFELQPELKQRFTENDFNLRTLMVDIVASSALHGSTD
jgi:cytochrome c553